MIDSNRVEELIIVFERLEVVFVEEQCVGGWFDGALAMD